MPKKDKEKNKIKEIRAPASSISPLISNVINVRTHKDFVMLDFGFVAPSYEESSDIFDDIQIARICIPWDAAEFLSEMLNDELSERKKTSSKTKKKNK